MSVLLNGLVAGIAFGFLLQRSRVIRYDRQVGALRLIDMTIVKFFFSAILTGMIGVQVLHQLGISKPLILPTYFAGNIVGGLIFGVGWALVGYCPGTSLGALGEGRVDAFWGILGMLAGAGIYAEVYPALSGNILRWGYEGSITLPGILGVSPWAVIVVFIIAALALFTWFERMNL